MNRPCLALALVLPGCSAPSAAPEALTRPIRPVDLHVLRASDDTPLDRGSGAEVWVRTVEFGDELIEFQAVAYSDDPGRWTTDGNLHEGELYTAFARLGNALGSTTFRLEEVDLPVVVVEDDGTAVVEVEPPEGMSGVVEARVYLSQERFGEDYPGLRVIEIASQSVSGTESARFEGLAPGVYDAHWVVRGAAGMNASRVGVPVAAGATARITPTLSPESVSSTTLTADSDRFEIIVTGSAAVGDEAITFPLEGAHVELLDEARRVLAEGETGPDGGWTLKQIPSGASSFSVRAPGFRQWWPKQDNLDAWNHWESWMRIPVVMWRG